MSTGVQTAAHHPSNHHQFHHAIHSPQNLPSQYQELSKMGLNNSEDHIVSSHPLWQPPITTSRQVSRESDISISHRTDDIQGTKALKELPSALQQASVITPRDNSDHSVIGSFNDTLSSLSSSSTKHLILEAANHGKTNEVVRQQASATATLDPSSNLSVSAEKSAAKGAMSTTAAADAPVNPTSYYTIPPPAITPQSVDNRSSSVGTKRKIESPSSQSSPSVSRRDSLPLGLRNKKMKATDCLLFAATLLEQETAETLVAARNSLVKAGSNSPQATIVASKPFVHLPRVKKTKPLKKMVCEKLERSLQEAAKQKKEQEELEQKEEELEQEEDQDSENKPNVADVLCGRGGKVNKHAGNIVYRKVVEHNKSYYQSVHKKHRILVSQSIVRAILNYGGRFMGQKGKEWTPICFKRAVQKTSQALRERTNTSDTIGDFSTASTGKQQLSSDAIGRKHFSANAAAEAPTRIQQLKIEAALAQK